MSLRAEGSTCRVDPGPVSRVFVLRAHSFRLATQTNDLHSDRAIREHIVHLLFYCHFAVFALFMGFGSDARYRAPYRWRALGVTAALLALFTGN